MTWPPTDRPIIVIDAAVKFGRPQIRGVSTEAIADVVAAGEGVDDVVDDYNLSRAEVLLACWYEGAQGAYRRQWQPWADAVHRLLADLSSTDLASVPEPPAHEELSDAVPAGGVGLPLVLRLQAAQLPSPGERRAIRERAGATLQEVATEVGVSAAAVHRWEQGECRRMRRQHAIAYRTVLDALRNAA